MRIKIIYLKKNYILQVLNLIFTSFISFVPVTILNRRMNHDYKTQQEFKMVLHVSASLQKLKKLYFFKFCYIKT